MSGMKLTNKALPNDPSIFPPPVTWMSWVGDRKVRKDANGRYMTNPDGTYVYEDVDGKIRYHYDYPDARKSLMWLGRESKWRKPEESGTFFYDWAVYEWENGEWVLRGEGRRGEKRKDNPFFNRKLTPEERAHPFDKAVEEKAIESILRSVQAS